VASGGGEQARGAGKEPERLDHAALIAGLPASAQANLEFAAVAYEQAVRDAVAAGALGFYARLFVQAGMPHSNPHTSQHVRSNGALTLTMMAPPIVGLPYGSLISPPHASSTPATHGHLSHSAAQVRTDLHT
jgi:hypothetical protein